MPLEINVIKDLKNIFIISWKLEWKHISLWLGEAVL